MANDKKTEFDELNKSNNFSNSDLEKFKKNRDVVVKKKRNKIRVKRISMSLTKNEEQEIDKAIEKNDKMSIMVIIVILVLCFVVGISLGWILYNIAINGKI